jgi:pyruvate/2-oxoglutarate dehydrogenase complex dihydrolipoamide acyltransferase (E2) component
MTNEILKSMSSQKLGSLFLRFHGQGLVVPVLRNVEAMNFAEVEKGIAELGRKAKDGEIAVEDMDGGTFTVSNGGVFGSLFGTPIINPPQSAILGMHGIFDRPVARNGQVSSNPSVVPFFAITSSPAGLAEESYEYSVLILVTWVAG